MQLLAIQGISKVIDHVSWRKRNNFCIVYHDINFPFYSIIHPVSLQTQPVYLFTTLSLIKILCLLEFKILSTFHLQNKDLCLKLPNLHKKM